MICTLRVDNICNQLLEWGCCLPNKFNRSRYVSYLNIANYGYPLAHVFEYVAEPPYIFPKAQLLPHISGWIRAVQKCTQTSDFLPKSVWCLNRRNTLRIESRGLGNQTTSSSSLVYLHHTSSSDTHSMHPFSSTVDVREPKHTHHKTQHSQFTDIAIQQMRHSKQPTEMRSMPWHLIRFESRLPPSSSLLDFL